jgi:hypothetical protein
MDRRYVDRAFGMPVVIPCMNGPQPTGRVGPWKRVGRCPDETAWIRTRSTDETFF